MSEINEKQNKIEFMRYQFCIRYLYTVEKRIYIFTMFINLVIFLLGSIPLINASEYFFVVPILWMPINQYFDSIRLRYHNNAVNYHEYKDRIMYNLNIPLGMIPKKQTILQDSITLVERSKVKERFVNMMNANHKTTIRDWYNDFSDYPLNLATIMSQDENTKWELRQRKLYQRLLYVILGILIITSCIIIQVKSYEIVSSLYVIPFVLALWNEVSNNRVVIEELKNCRENIGNVYCSIKNSNSNYVFIDEIRETVQMKMFLLRKDSNSVPNCIYKIFRLKLQKESNQYFDSLKTELNRVAKVN